MNNGLMRVFWPSDAPTGVHSGVLVGFRNGELDCLVVAVLRDVEALNVDNTLKLGTFFRNSTFPIGQLFGRCGEAQLQVLGVLNATTSEQALEPHILIAKTKPKTRFPVISCPRLVGVTLQVIIYDRPNPGRMQYLSLTPIALELGDDVERPNDEPAIFEPANAKEEAERKRKAALVEKLKLHTIIAHQSTSQELSLPTIVEQINCSHEIAAFLQKNIHLAGRTRAKRSMSVSERVAESASNLWDSVLLALRDVFTERISPLCLRLFVLVLMALRIVGEVILLMLEWRPLPNSLALKEVAATAQQVDIRLQQFCYWPIQYMMLRARKHTWKSITTSHPEYIRFYNSLWLVANDVIIGMAVGSYMIENADYVAAQLDYVLTAWTITGLQGMIVWLMGWPAGLKLNTELATFLGDLFLWVIDYWSGYMSLLRPSLPLIIYFIGLSSFAGATMPISLFSDLLSILTLHIYCFYVASAKIYNWQLTILFSLFHLFRGKKHNVLRNRIDSCDYDLDQLLLGTILFAILAFLLPTVMVYYATFAGARMGIISLKALLEMTLACLNHFPLFALMLRIKDSRRLPGGIRFRILASSSSEQTAHIYLNPVPLPLRLCFHSYLYLYSRLRAHYASFSVFFCLFTGRFVPPIPRKDLYGLQYGMLPKVRVGVGALWKRFRVDPLAKKRDGGTPQHFRGARPVLPHDGNARSSAAGRMNGLSRRSH